MKFKRTADGGNLTFPRASLKLCGFRPGEELALYTHEGAAVLLRQDMTAMDLIQALDCLSAMGAELLLALRELCGECEDCTDGGGCPCLLPHRDLPNLPAEIRDAAGIARDARLRAFLSGDGAATVVAADYAHDLSDVPDGVMELLASAGVCFRVLQEELMADEAVCVLEG